MNSSSQRVDVHQRTTISDEQIRTDIVQASPTSLDFGRVQLLVLVAVTLPSSEPLSHQQYSEQGQAAQWSQQQVVDECVSQPAASYSRAKQ